MPNFKPFEISSPGILKSLKIGVRLLQSGDTINTIVASTSLADVSIQNEVVNSVELTIPGESDAFPPGTVIVFDVTCAADVDVDENPQAILYFDYTTLGGERLRIEKAIDIRPYLQVE
jgi:hypothetical protein